MANCEVLSLYGDGWLLLRGAKEAASLAGAAEAGLHL